MKQKLSSLKPKKFHIKKLAVNVVRGNRDFFLIMVHYNYFFYFGQFYENKQSKMKQNFGQK